MTKSKIVAPTLISCGLIIPELHFGPFSCKWWLEISIEKGQETFPICIGMSIVMELNGQNFTVLFLHIGIHILLKNLSLYVCMHNCSSYPRQY